MYVIQMYYWAPYLLAQAYSKSWDHKVFSFILFFHVLNKIHMCTYRGIAASTLRRLLPLLGITVSACSTKHQYHKCHWPVTIEYSSLFKLPVFILLQTELRPAWCAWELDKPCRTMCCRKTWAFRHTVLLTCRAVVSRYDAIV